MEVGRLLHTFLLGSIRLWGLSLNFTLEEMVHPYVMVNFCILITKRQALVLREEFPGPNGTSLSKSRPYNSSF